MEHIEKMITLLAWIMVIPTSMFALIFMFGIIIEFCKKLTVTLHLLSLLIYFISALCWAWILSR